VVFGIATSLAYAAFILILRAGAADLRRIAGPLFYATLMSAVTAGVYGLIFGGVEWNPGWPAHGWLIVLALTSQVMGWLFISRSLPRLPAAVTSVILLLQPVGAMVFAALILAERPSFAQVAGAASILVGVVIAAAGHQRSLEPEGAVG
jgi:drug/metabolite transporter (DMT)-like permease